jgi:hypothetical protein
VSEKWVRNGILKLKEKMDVQMDGVGKKEQAREREKRNASHYSENFHITFPFALVFHFFCRGACWTEISGVSFKGNLLEFFALLKRFAEISKLIKKNF